MKHPSRFFIILAVSVSIAACSPPVGNISSKGGLEDMWAVPKRVAYYEMTDLFTRDHLKVLGMYRGAVESIPVKQVTIYIVENPDFSPDTEILFPSDQPFYDWKGYGRKEIVIKYHGKIYRYSVEVANGGGGPPGPDPDGSGIVVIWLK
jgi:hypothetical protein